MKILIKKIIKCIIVLGFGFIISCGSDNTEPQTIINNSVNNKSSISDVNYINSQMLMNLIDSKASLQIIDIRNKNDYLSGHIPGAVSIPYNELLYRLKELDTQSNIILYCNYGITSVSAAKSLQKLGFDKLYSLSEGYSKWEYAVELSNGRLMI